MTERVRLPDDRPVRLSAVPDVRASIGRCGTRSGRRGEPVKRTMAVILAGGEGERLSILSSVRAKPAVPFGGKYRIIDFTLSNCVNSEIDNVVVLTQYNPRSLNDHIGLGRPWDLDRNTGGVRMLQPYIKRGRVAEWYGGTPDAGLQHFKILDRGGDTPLGLAGRPTLKIYNPPL